MDLGRFRQLIRDAEQDCSDPDARRRLKEVVESKSSRVKHAGMFDVLRLMVLARLLVNVVLVLLS